jgi:transcriptional regulator with XRE-family HTH domain
MGKVQIQPKRHLDSEIAAGLRVARQQMGWSLRVASRHIGLSLGMLAELERGNRVPSKALAADTSQSGRHASAA